ncbi:MAG: IS91 family transposase [Pseudomonadota bacterium]
MEIVSGKISIRQIFLSRQAWLSFWITNIVLLRWAIVWNVAKMLLCRSGWGHREYSCWKCGTTKRVPHTCKSRFCSSCGKAASERWVETSLSDILDVPYKHLVFTIPEQFRDWFRMNRKAGLDALFLAVKDTLLTYSRQRGYRPGLILVLHTFGADLKWNTHIHVIITTGGLSIHKDRWIDNHYIPQDVIRPMYRYALLKELKKAFKQGKFKPPPKFRFIKSYSDFNSWLSQFYNKEWYVRLGETLKEASVTVKYVGRYSKRPVLAESRIETFDGKSVTFTYKDRATGETVSLALPVAEFIGRLVQHIPDQNYRIIRHSGIFATRVRQELLNIARTLLEQTPQSKPDRLSYSDLYKKTFDRDPLACPKCGSKMTLTRISFVFTKDIRSRVEDKHSQLEELYHARQKETIQIQKATYPQRASP